MGSLADRKAPMRRIDLEEKKLVSINSTDHLKEVRLACLDCNKFCGSLQITL